LRLTVHAPDARAAEARTELQTYAAELRWVLDQIAISLDGLTPAQLNWRPAATANSAYAIATHVVASTRVYALGFGCGQPVERDRAAEFAATGDDAGKLLGAIRRLVAEIEAALAGLAPGALDRRVLPSQELWGTGTPREVSGREALVESLRHAALHLGELRLTRDLARQHA
jgi:uncharacterized damage-inducible protein DinB